MKLINKKFIEFSFEPNLVTNLDKGFVTIKYLSSWKDLFAIRKPQIEFELIFGKECFLKIFTEIIPIKQDDKICVQLFHREDYLHIVINRPIDTEHIDTNKFQDTFADIFGKSDFKLFHWWNIKTNCQSIRTNYI
jgi:hypothetical protein